MVNYQDGKIYKLVGSGLTYYGSTTQRLSQRKAEHKKKSYSNKRLFELGDVDIVLVEAFPCNNKEELHARERYYIENNECVNKNIPTRTDKEYKEFNKDKYKEYREHNKNKIKSKKKQYYEKNKEYIKDKANKYILYKKIDKIFFD
jgi:hypothetical protein